MYSAATFTTLKSYEIAPSVVAVRGRRAAERGRRHRAELLLHGVDVDRQAAAHVVESHAVRIAERRRLPGRAVGAAGGHRAQHEARMARRRVAHRVAHAQERGSDEVVRRIAPRCAEARQAVGDERRVQDRVQLAELHAAERPRDADPRFAAKQCAAVRQCAACRVEAILQRRSSRSRRRDPRRPSAPLRREQVAAAHARHVVRPGVRVFDRGVDAAVERHARLREAARASGTASRSARPFGWFIVVVP